MARILALLFLSLALVACGDDAEKSGTQPLINNGVNNGSTNNGTTGTNNGTVAVNNGTTGELISFSALTPGKFTEVLTGGDTICSRGTEYAFYVWPGDPEKVLINFMGGGACWNVTTCSVASAIFEEDINDLRALATLENPELPGIFDMANEANPFKDWTHIIVPYCTGDVHWGDSVTTYGSFDIQHKGAVNTKVVLDWVESNFETVDRSMVTGCSAGSYGSIMWSAHMAEMYPAAKIYQFGDSGAGVITQTFFRDSFPSWNAQVSFPYWIDALDPEAVDIEDLDLPALYNEIAAANPNAIFSQFNTVLDENQTFFYEAMGGEGGAPGWSTRMRGNVDVIKANSGNFYSWLGEGEKHCIIPDNEFFTVETNGTKLVDWLDDMVNDRAIDHVECVGCIPE